MAITATLRRPPGYQEPVKPTITETLAFAEAPDLCVVGRLRDGSIRIIPVERGLLEERLKQLLPSNLGATTPAIRLNQTVDHRKSGIVVVGVADLSDHGDLRYGDEFETVTAFAGHLGVSPAQISNYLARARAGANPAEDRWPQATLHGVTFMARVDYEKMITSDGRYVD